MAKFLDRITDYIANYMIQQICYEEAKELSSTAELVSLKYRKDPDALLEKFYPEPLKDKKAAIESLQPIFTELASYKTPIYSYDAKTNTVILPAAVKISSLKNKQQYPLTKIAEPV